MVQFSWIPLLASFASTAFAAEPIPNIIPLSVTGYLEGCTAESQEYNAGGSISVDGWTIKVPKNLLVQFPVVWAPFPKLCQASALGYEVSVVGNVVDGEPRAALLSVSAGLSLRAGQGYIQSLTTDSIQIRGGPVLRINDPKGVFGKVQNLNPFFPVDDENPSITAFSGFPMCLQREANDPKCPSSNRPTGSTNFAPSDPKSMVPFRVGDFIEYAGLKGEGGIIIYEAAAINVQATTTASSTVPNYIRVEDALIGVTDNANNVEVADARFIGFLSSCNGASVTIHAIETDPCTGQEVLRQVGSATPKAGDDRCKWEARITNIQTPYTREYVVKANNGQVETNDGIAAGTYVTPVTEWILPEVDVPGTEPPPFRFSDIRGLVQGDYLDEQRFGPLSPFPGANPPAPLKTCSASDPTTPTTPTNPTDPGTGGGGADPVAAAVQIAAVQRVGAQVFLAGSNTNDRIANSDLVFAWSKTAPTSATVSLGSPAAATATFVAPKVTTTTNYTFEVKVSLKSDSTKSSTANVTVSVNPTANDVVKVDSYTWESRQSGTIGVSCSSNVANGDNKRMQLVLNGGGTPITMTKASEGKWSYSSRNVKQPTNIQCVSDLGGKSDLVTAPRRRKRGLIGIL